MKQSIFVFIVALLITTAFTFINATWQVKDNSYSVKFDTRGASGTIGGLKGTIIFDEANLPGSAFNVTVDVNTLNTGNNLKNRHAKAEGFFDAEKYPNIKYTSSKITKTPTGYQVTGNLKIKSTTKAVVIPFTFDKRENEGTFRGNFEINRKDYDLHKFGVGEVIKVEMVIPVRKLK